MADQLHSMSVGAVPSHEVGAGRLPPIQLHLLTSRVAEVRPFALGTRSHVGRSGGRQSCSELIGAGLLGTQRMVEGHP
jgi:hypothetical protein